MFLKTWYQTLIRTERVTDALKAWLSDRSWTESTPTLVFTRPDHSWTPFFPKRSIEVVDVKKANTILELRFEIENGVSDPWYETVRASELPKVVKDFLRIDSDEDEIYITLGPNIDWWKRLHR